MIDRHLQIRRERRTWMAIYFLVPYVAIVITILSLTWLGGGIRALRYAWVEVALLSLIPALLSMIFSLREDRRMRPAVWDDKLIYHAWTLCPKCGYDLRATDAPRCPECGAPIESES